MYIAICDDNLGHINIIENELQKIAKEKNIELECDVYQDGESIIDAYKNNMETYDAVFLDMEMNKLNGIETANIIRKTDRNIIILFVTSHSEYMKESFKCEPFRFIEKPLNIEELKEAFDAVCKKLSEDRKSFIIKENKTIIRLFCDDIIYCESDSHWVCIYTKDKTYKICKTLSELYKLLDPKIIFRVHKSFLVNFKYIYTIKENNIQLYCCDKLIPISRSYKKTVMEEFTNFMERNLYL